MSWPNYPEETGADFADDIWEDYSSEFMFNGDNCTNLCIASDHDAADHDYSGCTVCDCPNFWEHT